MPKQDQWDTSVFHTSPILHQLSNLTRHFSGYASWPTINDYQAIFKLNNIGIAPVAQSTAIESFEDQYEPRVYLKKELQTRTENWHDFFNAMIWMNFPQTKKMLNSLHFNTASNRKPGTNRSTLENRITQFDECGAVVITSNKALLELIRNHQWKELFIEHKDSFENEIKCVIFGHAIFEKALTPYIGMTCHCILIEDKKLLKAAQEADYTSLDLHLAELWEHTISNKVERFNALPVLGIPGYWSDQSVNFYNNEKYFRSK
jgi:Protein of unknown function (DUF3025)